MNEFLLNSDMERQNKLIKAVVLDLDGTLLKDDKSISEKSKKVLDECKRKNILIGFSTSRAMSNSLAFEEIIQPDFIIGSGGAYIYISGKSSV